MTQEFDFNKTVDDVLHRRDVKDDKKTVAIVGYGVVGKAMASFFMDRFNVVLCDPVLWPTWDKRSDYRHLHKSHSGAEKFLQVVQYPDLVGTDLAVVCVPTPISEIGGCDLSFINSAISLIQSPLILIKSTIPPGTTDRLRDETGKRIVFSPEYLGESTYWSPHKFDRDVKETPFFTFGGDPRDCSAIIDFFSPIAGPTKIYRQTDAKSAELAKYAENCFFYSKLMFCYELAEICKSMNADYNEVRELWLLDPRINPMHTMVLKDNIPPVSGRCVPGDALVKTEDGDLEISSLYGDFCNSYSLPRVKSKTSSFRENDLKEIESVTMREYTGELVSFTLPDGTVFSCTPEHFIPVFDADGFFFLKRAEQVLQTDLLIQGNVAKFVNPLKIDRVQVQNVKVYNLELKSDNQLEDDLYWIEAKTGLINHNCLPKDLKALIECSRKNSYEPNLLIELENSNKRIAEIRVKEKNTAADNKAPNRDAE